MNDATQDTDDTPAAIAPTGVAVNSATVSAKTGAAVVPMMPANLTAEASRDTNVAGVGNRGVLLLWNAPADPDGAKVTGYKIERSINGGEYSIRVENMPANRTFWVDRTELLTNSHTYRVTSRNAVGSGTEMATVTIPLAMHTTHPPYALSPPTSPTAMAGSTAGTVDLSWMAGANATQHWILAIRADGALTGYTWVPASGDSSHTLTELDSGVAYIFGVNAGNAAGEWAGWVFTTGMPN